MYSMGAILEQFRHCFIDFGCTEFGHPHLKFLYISLSKKCKVFVNHDKLSQQSRNINFEALNIQIL